MYEQRRGPGDRLPVCANATSTKRQPIARVHLRGMPYGRTGRKGIIGGSWSAWDASTGHCAATKGIRTVGLVSQRPRPASSQHRLFDREPWKMAAMPAGSLGSGLSAANLCRLPIRRCSAKAIYAAAGESRLDCASAAMACHPVLELVVSQRSTELSGGCQCSDPLHSTTLASQLRRCRPFRYNDVIQGPSNPLALVTVVL
jgi:hypothetical protein